MGKLLLVRSPLTVCIFYIVANFVNQRNISCEFV